MAPKHLQGKGGFACDCKRRIIVNVINLIAEGLALTLAFGAAVVASYGMDRLLKRRMPSFVRGAFVLVVGYVLLSGMGLVVLWITCRHGCDL